MVARRVVAIARVLEATQPAAVYELAGPRVYSYRDLLEAVSKRLGLRRILLPVPFAIWQTVASFAERQRLVNKDFYDELERRYSVK